MVIFNNKPKLKVGQFLHYKKNNFDLLFGKSYNCSPETLTLAKDVPFTGSYFRSVPQMQNAKLYPS